MRSSLIRPHSDLHEQEAKKRPEVLQLMTHPGVGPLTGLAYVLVIGTPERFPCGKQIGSYTGLMLFACTGCGEMAGTIRSWSSSVRTRESS
jgi:hypothetical protein